MQIGKKYLINKLFRGTNISEDLSQIYLVFSIVLLSLLVVSISFDKYILLAIPAALLGSIWIFQDIKGFYFLLFAVLPLSMEIDLPGGFSTDLPDEPMMIIMMGLIVLYILRRYKTIPAFVILHPITLVLLIHYFWIWTTSLTSMDLIPSIKFSLSKTWYIVVFYFGPLILFKSINDYKRVFKLLLISLVFATGYVLIRHAPYNFSFEMVNKVVYPFFRNHVNSSSMMVLALPFLWALYRLEGLSKYQKYLILFGSVILLAGIFFSYTRAAIISVFIGIGIYFVIQRRWMKYMIGLSFLISGLLIGNWAKDNKYLNFAPDFEHTITHTEFSDLLSATYKLQDISTMERVYRWVAGYHMIKDKPILGFGPANFHSYYKSYTLHSFRTYVSDNPEKSGVHSYYMMVAIEQGLVGLLIFLGLCVFFLLYGESIYHKLDNKEHRLIAMSALISFGIILSILIMNDMIETDKVGPFFFLSMAILVFLEEKNRHKKTLQKTNK